MFIQPIASARVHIRSGIIDLERCAYRQEPAQFMGLNLTAAEKLANGILEMVAKARSFEAAKDAAEQAATAALSQARGESQ